MVLQSLAPIVVRPRRMALLLVPVLLASSVVGCSGSRRSAMRPVYVGPARPVTVVPAPATVVSPPTTTIETAPLDGPAPA
ncbi:hypothetical protein ACYOEI_33980, partial [Singulisphaera rosea]